MNRRISVIIQALIMLVVGAVFLWFYSSGRMERYLTSAGSFQEQALLAGVVLGILALFLILTSGKEDICCHDHHDHDHGSCDHDDHKHEHDHAHQHTAACDHDHGHDHHDHGHHHDDGHHHHHDEDTVMGLLTTAAVVAVPLLVAAVLTPDAYSKNWTEKNGLYSGKGVIGDTPEAFDLKKKGREGEPGKAGEGDDKNAANKAAAGWGPYTIDDFKAQVDANDDGEFLMDVVSIFYTGGDEEVQNVVAGLPVETMGQVMPEKIRNSEGKRVRAFRLMMNCCIADARPVSIPVEFADGVPDYKEMGWYKIHGTIAYEQWDGFTIPVVRATKLVETVEPEQGTFGQRQ